MLPSWPPQSYTITIHVCCFSQELRASKLSSFSDMRNNTVLASSVTFLGGYAAIQTGKRQLLQEAVTDPNLSSSKQLPLLHLITPAPVQPSESIMMQLSVELQMSLV